MKVLTLSTRNTYIVNIVVRTLMSKLRNSIDLLPVQWYKGASVVVLGGVLIVEELLAEVLAGPSFH